jgi:hypothetical protein
VAVYIGTGETVYLLPKEARHLTRAINRVARSCDQETFTESKGLTASFTFAKVAK